MAYVSHRIGESRLLDCIYDKSFILSGKTDIQRANSNAMAMSTPVQILSRYDVMFSCIPKVLRQICWKEQKIIPDFHLRGGQESSKQDAIDVKGKNRTNFFYYPPNNINIVNICLNIEDFKSDCKIEEKNRTIGCQTVYRESCSQTTPYQPDYVAHGNPINSNILMTSKILYGYEKPGEIQTKIIERTLKYRKWEQNITRLSSAKDIKKYRAIMEAFEWEEWVTREEEIEEYQNMRMQIIHRLIEKRNDFLKKSSECKLQSRTENIMERQKKQLNQLEINYNRNLRKLNYKHNNVTRRYKKDKISEEYSDPASDLYGPQMRFGTNPKRKHFVGFKDKFDNRLDDLDKRITQSNLKCPFEKLNFLAQPKERPKEFTQGFCKDKYLKNLYESLKFFRHEAAATKDTPKCFIRKEIILKSTLDTATVIGVEQDNLAEAEYQCCTYLQKIIKGRALQNMLFSGKEEFRGLIDEISSTYTLTAVKEMFPNKVNENNQNKFKALSRQKRIERIFKNEKNIEKVLEDFEGSTIGCLLELFENELDRLHELKKIQAICMLTEKERLKREALEAGLRQIEFKRRAEHQETYNHLTKATRDTVSLYLTDVLIDETDLKADAEANKKIENMAKHIDKTAVRSLKANKRSSIRKMRDDESTIITDIVNQFIFPEIQKKIARKNMELRNRRHLIAAHKALYSTLDSVFPKSNLLDEQTHSSELITKCLINNLLERVVSSTSSHIENYYNQSAGIDDIIKMSHRTENTNCSRLYRILSDLQSELCDDQEPSSSKKK